MNNQTTDPQRFELSLPKLPSAGKVPRQKLSSQAGRMPSLITLIIAIIAVLVISGCGNDEPDPTAVPTEAPTEAPVEAPTEEPTEEPTAAPEEAPTDTPEPEGNGDSGEGNGEEGTTDGASDGTDQADLPDIYTFASAQPETAQFAGLVDRLDFAEKLQSEGPFTAFIPTNRAIDSLPLVVQEDDELLFDILLYHIVAEEIPNQNLYDWESATTLLGDELPIFATDYGAVVSNANLLGVTDQVNNGILYIIDKVLFPPDLIEYALDQTAVAGEETILSQGNLHIDLGARSPIPYNSTPPTSGPHFPNIVAWEVYEEPIRYEQVVHNLEDAGVLIYYQCDEACPDLLAELTEFAQPFLDEGRHLAVLPNDPTWSVGDDSELHQDMGASIAMVAWQKLLKLDEVDAEKMSAFIDAYEGIDNHAKY